MSVQSDWESNCPRAVLPILHQNLSYQRERVVGGGENFSTGSFAILFGDK